MSVYYIVETVCPGVEYGTMRQYSLFCEKKTSGLARVVNGKVVWEKRAICEACLDLRIQQLDGGHYEKTQSC